MVNQVEYKKIFSKNGGITIKYYLKLFKKNYTKLHFNCTNSIFTIP